MRFGSVTGPSGSPTHGEVVFVFVLTFKLPQTIPIERLNQPRYVCCWLWSLNTGIMKLWMVLHGDGGGRSWYEVQGTDDVCKVGGTHGTLGTTGS